MKNLKSIFLITLGFVASSCLVGCGKDEVSPTINNVIVPQKIYVNQNVQIKVDATDNKTASTNLTYSYRVTHGTTLLEVSDKGVFTPTEEGTYEIQVRAFDEAGNYTLSDKITRNCSDATKGWTDKEKALFTSYFNEILPFPEGVNSDSCFLEEYTLSNSYISALLFTTTAFDDESVVTNYMEFLTSFGFELYGTDEVTAKDEITTYDLNFFIKHQDFEEDKNKYLVLQISYFPGYDENYEDDYAEPTFDIIAYYQNFNVDTYTSNKWEPTLIKTALNDCPLVSSFPEYVATGENPVFTYSDRHKMMNQGSLYLQIEGTNLDDLETFVSGLEDNGFLGCYFNDLVNGNRTNTIFVMSNSYFIMYIRNDLSEDNTIKMIILYDNIGASSSESTTDE